MVVPIEDYPELVQKYTLAAEKLGIKNPQFSTEDGEGGVNCSEHTRRYILRGQWKPVGEDAYFEEEDLASGCLTGLPGCCGVGVMHDASAAYSDDILQLMFELREDLARKANWGVLQQTDTSRNRKTPRILRSLGGWRAVNSNWRNPNSGNHVTLWTKDLTRPVKPKKPKSPKGTL